jgi:hypothetical protein
VETFLELPRNFSRTTWKHFQNYLETFPELPGHISRTTSSSKIHGSSGNITKPVNHKFEA